MFKSRWIYIALSAVISGVLCFTAGIFIAYKHTKAAYRAQGINEGLLSANVTNFKRIQKIVGNMPTCTDNEFEIGKTIATAKPEVILAIATNSNLYRFCSSIDNQN